MSRAPKPCGTQVSSSALAEAPGSTDNDTKEVPMAPWWFSIRTWGLWIIIMDFKMIIHLIIQDMIMTIQIGWLIIDDCQDYHGYSHCSRQTVASSLHLDVLRTSDTLADAASAAADGCHSSHGQRSEYDSTIKHFLFPVAVQSRKRESPYSLIYHASKLGYTIRQSVVQSLKWS